MSNSSVGHAWPDTKVVDLLHNIVWVLGKCSHLSFHSEKTKACSNAEHWLKSSTALEKFHHADCYSLWQIVHSPNHAYLIMSAARVWQLEPEVFILQWLEARPKGRGQDTQNLFPHSQWKFNWPPEAHRKSTNIGTNTSTASKCTQWCQCHTLNTVAQPTSCTSTQSPTLHTHLPAGHCPQAPHTHRLGFGWAGLEGHGRGQRSLSAGHAAGQYLPPTRYVTCARNFAAQKRNCTTIRRKMISSSGVSLRSMQMSIQCTGNFKFVVSVYCTHA